MRIAGLVEAARADTPNCLLFDNGDTFQGGALGDLAAQQAARGNGPHPMILAMNALGYDAATLGNHDFDYGIDLLRGILADAGFPVVLANAQYPGNGEPFRPRHVLLERDVQDLDGAWHVLRIGVTGTVPPQVSRWNRSILNGDLIFGDAVAAAACEAQSLKAAGADIVVVLTHSGLEDCETNLASVGDGPDIGEENVARTIAALAEVDVVIAGHTHEVFPPEGECDIVPPNVPIVQPGSLGSHLGCIDLALVKQQDGAADGWKNTQGRSRGAAARRHGTGGRRKSAARLHPRTAGPAPDDRRKAPRHARRNRPPRSASARSPCTRSSAPSRLARRRS